MSPTSEALWWRTMAKKKIRKRTPEREARREETMRRAWTRIAERERIEADRVARQQSA